MRDDEMRNLLIGSIACLSLLIVGCGPTDGVDEEAGPSPEIGVTDTEILFGTHTDLTGPIALYGVESVNGVQMRFDEVNAAGGVHGRQLRFIVEDSQYDVTRSLSAANKLLNQDKIFAMLLALGTPNNNAVLTQQLPLGVPNLFPLTGSIQMGEPLHPLKFTQRGVYYTEMRYATNYFITKFQRERPCSVYVDNDFGFEIYSGVVDELEEMGLELMAYSSHKPTETEFTAALVNLHDAGCDLVLLGTVLRDTILLLEGVRKMDWHDAIWVGNNAAAGRPVAAMESGASEGYYAMTHVLPVYPEDPSVPAAALEWYHKYVELYGAVPDVAAMEGYRGADLAIKALEIAGPDLTREKFLSALESLSNYKGIYGNTLTFGPTDHNGVDQSMIIQVRNKRWVKLDETIELSD